MSLFFFFNFLLLLLLLWMSTCVGDTHGSGCCITGIQKDTHAFLFIGFLCHTATPFFVLYMIEWQCKSHRHNSSEGGIEKTETRLAATDGTLSPTCCRFGRGRRERNTKHPLEVGAGSKQFDFSLAPFQGTPPFPLPFSHKKSFGTIHQREGEDIHVRPHSRCTACGF